jgi:hypothetical protein
MPGLGGFLALRQKLAGDVVLTGLCSCHEVILLCCFTLLSAPIIARTASLPFVTFSTRLKRIGSLKK